VFGLTIALLKEQQMEKVISMNNKVVMSMSFLFVLVQALHAEPSTRRATIMGGVGTGKCTIEVNVDGAAEVEVSGDTGVLTTLSGQTAVWRRFQCSQPLPSSPIDFRMVGIDGRGSVRLIRDPGRNRGTAVIRIEDPKGGREGYTFDLRWRLPMGGEWPSGPMPFPPGHYPDQGGSPVARTVQLCQDAVTDRLNRDGYPYVTFERTTLDNNPGRRDWVSGAVSGRRGFDVNRFSFACSVDFNSGRVRSVDIRRR
jgi:hypothetical protein